MAGVAGPAKASSSDLLVTDLEVATVTDTSVVITWFTGTASATDEYGFPRPVAADTELQLGDVDLTTLTIVPGSLKTVYQDSMQFPVSVGGSLDFPGTFTTLTTPPGKYLFTLALCNDLRQSDRNVDRLLVAGDLTSNGLLSEAVGVKQLLDGWGTLQRDYFVARGNHDRSRNGSSWNTCTPVPGTNPEHLDCWGDVFSYVLSKDKDRPTILFGHHPITYESAATTEAGPSFDIDRPTAIELQRLYEKALGVFFHHSGHTYRNKRTFLLDDQQNPVQSVEFLEVGATKEYPGGYSLLRLYTGGYMVLPR